MKVLHNVAPEKGKEEGKMKNEENGGEGMGETANIQPNGVGKRNGEEGKMGAGEHSTFNAQHSTLSGERGEETHGRDARATTGRETWTIQPEADVVSLMRKAINEAVREAGDRGLKLGRRGLRTRLLNEAFRAQYAHLRGKREAV